MAELDASLQPPAMAIRTTLGYALEPKTNIPSRPDAFGADGEMRAQADRQSSALEAVFL
ncbi:MAG: hypothetical protein P4M13_03550 [Alphaproteobacteria bacterium]|nr:hypothetical protein [Alphaproteobacteria bacterium]